VSRPRFARRLRGHRALTLAFSPRLIIPPSGGCRVPVPRNALPQVESLLIAIVLLDIETVQQIAVVGDLVLEKYVFKRSNKRSLTSIRLITYSDLLGSG
jgi:hypothetical protein